MQNTSDIGIIFDCDGTLIDSMAVWHEVDNRLAALVGIELTQTDRDFMTAGTLLECSQYLHERYAIGACTQDVVDMIYDNMLHYYTHEARPKPGALEFVRGAYEMGIPLGVASSTPPALLHAGLEATGFAPYMRTIMSVEDLNTSKREPLVYNTVLKSLGTPRNDTWGFEDALYAINTLSASGYPTVAIYDSEIAGTPATLADAADCFIMSFTDFSAQQFVEMAQLQAKHAG